MTRFFIFFLFTALVSGCGIRPPALGTAGQYRTGRSLLIQGRTDNIADSVPYFEAVAKKDPFYRDTLTLLGRALYYQGAYQDAFQLLQRALAVNKEDEIAWLTLGLTQLRMKEDEKGFENLKTGVALVNKVSKNGYRGYVRWDINGLIRASVRRAIVVVSKDGLGAKEELIRTGEQILRRIDDEEIAQESEARRSPYKEDFKR